MAPYVKSLDPNHLLSIGEEGFYSATNPASAYNPQGGCELPRTTHSNEIACYLACDISVCMGSVQHLKGNFGSFGGALDLPHYISGPAENLQESVVLLQD